MAQTVVAAVSQPHQTDIAPSGQPTPKGKVVLISVGKGKGVAQEPKGDELTAVLDLFFM